MAGFLYQWFCKWQFLVLLLSFLHSLSKGSVQQEWSSGFYTLTRDESHVPLTNHTLGTQRYPFCLPLTNEYWYSIWESDHSGTAEIFGQKHRVIDGSLVGQRRRLSGNYSATDKSETPYAVKLKSNNHSIAVLWRTERSDGVDFYSIRLRLFNFDGLPLSEEMTLWSSKSQITRPTMATLLRASSSSENSYFEMAMVVWDQQSDGQNGRVFRMEIRLDSMQLGSVRLVSADSAFASRVYDLRNDRFIVVYNADIDPSETEEDWNIRVRMYNASGLEQSSEFQMNDDNDYPQRSPDVAPLSQGFFVSVWEHEQSEIFGSVFDSEASKCGTEFLVNTNVLDSQVNPVVFPLPEIGDLQRFVVSWVTVSHNGSEDGTYAQLFEFRIPGVICGGTNEPLKIGPEWRVNWNDSNQAHDHFVWSGASLDSEGEKFVIGLDADAFDSNGIGVKVQMYNLNYTGPTPQPSHSPTLQPSLMIANDDDNDEDDDPPKKERRERTPLLERAWFWIVVAVLSGVFTLMCVVIVYLWQTKRQLSQLDSDERVLGMLDRALRKGWAVFSTPGADTGDFSAVESHVTGIVKMTEEEEEEEDGHDSDDNRDQLDAVIPCQPRVSEKIVAQYTEGHIMMKDGEIDMEEEEDENDDDIIVLPSQPQTRGARTESGESSAHDSAAPAGSVRSLESNLVAEGKDDASVKEGESTMTNIVEVSDSSSDERETIVVASEHGQTTDLSTLGEGAP